MNGKGQDMTRAGGKPKPVTAHEKAAQARTDDIAAGLKGEAEVFVSPQWRITAGGKERLMPSSTFLKKAGLEMGEKLNYWRKGGGCGG